MSTVKSYATASIKEFSACYDRVSNEKQQGIEPSSKRTDAKVYLKSILALPLPSRLFAEFACKPLPFARVTHPPTLAIQLSIALCRDPSAKRASDS